MTNREKLDLIMLLSAIESWSFSAQTRLPDYLHDKLCNAVELLTNKVLETK
jgi:predicted nucleotidyltransferase